MLPSIVNVSDITGERVTSRVTSWQTRNGPFNVEHLAGRNPAGDLIVFWWSPQHDWQSVNVSQKTGQQVAGDVTSWQTPNGPFNVEHLAGRNPAGDLIVFWWSPQHDWQALDVSHIAGGNIIGAPDSFQLRDADGNAEMLVARGTGNSLLYYWWKPAFDWQMADLSKLTGQNIYTDPEAWTTPSGDHVVEHLACAGDKQSLLVFWFDAEIRREGISTDRWVSIGPRNITCVIRAIAADPDSPAMLYAGAEFGGVWKTADYGATWTSTMDAFVNPCVSALAVSRSQPGIVYSGMSPGRAGAGTSVTLYRSDDHGVHWKARNPVASTFCRGLALHPADPDILYFAGDQGLHKSVDGGTTWTSVLTGDIDDVKIDTDTPSTLYASVRGRGIFKSTTDGTNWTQKGVGVAFTVRNDGGSAQNAALDGSFRTLLAVGEDHRAGRHGTQFIAAKVQGTIVTSTDGGDNWRVLPGTDHGIDDQNWWDSCLAVCPSDEDFIVTGGSSIQFTLNASSPNPAWQDLPDPLHVDQQSIAFTPTSPADFYFANDGYIGRALSRGASSPRVSDGLSASQCFNVAVSQGPALVAGCSTYHTGTIRTGRTAFLQWEAIDGPEGGLFEIDSSDGATMFGSPWAQNKLHRSQDGGNSWEQFDITLDDGSITYMQTMGIRPDDPSQIYASAFFGRLHYSTNGGDEWAVIMGAPGGPLLPNAGAGRGDGSFTFAYAPSNGAYAYLGTKSGHLWRTTNAATTAAGWTELNPPLPIGTGPIGAIAVAPDNPDIVLIGYQINALRQMWRGIVGPGGLVQWTDAGGSPTASLPLVYVNAIVIDPVNDQRIFAATTVGMFATANAGTTWKLFSDGLPRIRVIDMRLRKRTRMLYAAVYGRGIFRRRI
jgi:hypothetical protein